jgi:beta-lactam-binding protein with PASTA domain
MEIRTTAVAAAALLLSATVTAHEHHDDKIEEGHVISDDPIVRHELTSRRLAG